MRQQLSLELDARQLGRMRSKIKEFVANEMYEINEVVKALISDKSGIFIAGIEKSKTSKKKKRVQMSLSLFDD